MKNFGIFGASACAHGVLPLVQHDEVQLGEGLVVTNPARVLLKENWGQIPIVLCSIRRPWSSSKGVGAPKMSDLKAPTYEDRYQFGSGPH
jgi:hypothetical protein